MGKGSLNIWARVENAGDSHGFGRIGSITGRKCSWHEFESRQLQIFRRGMQKGVPAARNCRLAQEAAKDGAVVDGLGEKQGWRDEMAGW